MAGSEGEEDETAASDTDAAVVGDGAEAGGAVEAGAEAGAAAGDRGADDAVTVVEDGATSHPPSAAPVSGPRHRAERVPRQRRRVTTSALPGTDPAPQNEPPRHAENENDERLKADKPPHWGQ